MRLPFIVPPPLVPTDELGLPGLKLLRPARRTDARGTFVKPFSEPEFADLGLATHWAEAYYSHSTPGVVRGMHLQLPPHHHAKLVTCVQGRVLDVALDLRQGPTFGHFRAVELAEATGYALYLPAGFAHGFCVPANQAAGATVLYMVSSAYAPEVDSGIAFDSFGFEWPLAHPVVSDRDRALPTLAQFTPLSC